MSKEGTTQVGLASRVQDKDTKGEMNSITNVAFARAIPALRTNRIPSLIFPAFTMEISFASYTVVSTSEPSPSQSLSKCFTQKTKERSLNHAIPGYSSCNSYDKDQSDPRR